MQINADEALNQELKVTPFEKQMQHDVPSTQFWCSNGLFRI